MLALAEQLGTFTPLVGGPEHVHCLLVGENCYRILLTCLSLAVIIAQILLNTIDLEKLKEIPILIFYFCCNTLNANGILNSEIV